MKLVGIIVSVLIAILAVQAVGARTADQRIISRPGQEGGVARIPLQQIIAVAAIEQVRLRPAIQRVVAIIPEQRIRAFVPEPAQGFVIETPDYQAVDLGTEFAMSVGSDGRSEVHVVDGEVRLDEKDGRELNRRTEFQVITGRIK
jgi:hypothetical protein